ncbi:MAG: zinc-ribbon domain-containing protein, partial [Candidatus Thermoplasmatota archaeon]|nr:zinc-ribbon domain-containing protein [Candidatus Thermoplasmatota archaeon]
VAPIKESLSQESTSNDNLTMTSMSDDGGIVSSTVQETPPVQIQRKESIEDLAMLSGGTVSTSQPVGAGGGCPSCGATNPPSERYCQSCGSTLSA